MSAKGEDTLPRIVVIRRKYKSKGKTMAATWDDESETSEHES